MWMGFLTGYVLPKKYYESVGAEGFEAKPVGSGPYMVDEFQQNAFLRLKANPNYWGGKPAFDTVIYKFIPDPTSRVAELESGSSDITLEIPYEEFDRLKENPDFTGYSTPISDIAMIFLNDVGPMLDKNVRLAANYAIDKKAIVDRLLRGYGVVIDTLAGAGIFGLRSRRSRFPTIPPRPPSSSPRAASRRRTRSSSRSRPPAASSRRTTR